MADHRLDDIPDTVTRAECAITLTLDGVRKDLELCREINETVAFDKDTIVGYLDRAEALALQAGELRQDMEAHLRATGRAWLDEA